VLRVSEVVNDRRVRARATTVLREDALEVDGSVEAEASIIEDVDPVRLVVTWGVEDGDLSVFILVSVSLLCFPNIKTPMLICKRGEGGKTRTSPPWTKYPVTSRFFLSGEIFT
jgi:hypothetical protein